LAVKYETLNGLSCPICGRSLALRESFVKKGDEVFYGTVGCGCNEYPILDGILVLRSDGLSRWAVKALAEHNFAGALLLLIKWDAPVFSSLLPKNANTIIINVLQFLAKLSKKHFALEADCLTFCQLVEKLGLGRYGNYLTHRFSCHTFWNVYALLPLLDEVGGPILDFGCGAGHASFVFSHFLQPSNIFCVDANFFNLFLAKEYCVNSQFVCVDEGSSLPFANSFFSLVFCLDAFHYVKSKLATSMELQRILKNRGAIVMAHLHNALRHNINPGTPLPASSYSKLFDSLKTVTFPEDQLLLSFLCEDLVALRDTCSQRDIDSFNTVTLIACHSQELFKEYHEVKRYLFSMKEFLIINPLYKLIQSGDDYFLKRVNPDRIFMKEFYLTEKILPQVMNIKKTTIEAIMTKRYECYEKEISKLIESFVLVDVPNRY
jgi:SAM-dependent methyltransferase